MCSKAQMISLQKGNLSSPKLSSLERSLVMADIYLNVPGCQTKILLISFAFLAKSQVHISNPFLFFPFLSSFFFFPFALFFFKVPVSSDKQFLYSCCIDGSVIAEWACQLCQSRHAGTHDVFTPCHLTALQVAEMCISSMRFNNWAAKAVKYQALPAHALLCQMKP